MLKYLIPQIDRADWWPLLRVAIICGLIAGMYGIVHDQITYTISPEYFTQLKFKQFHWADFRWTDSAWGNRVFAGTIGFLATWWVGAIAGWFLARRFIPGQPRPVAMRQIRRGILCIVTCGVGCGMLGYLFGLWRGPDADYFSWNWAFAEFVIVDKWSFVRVAYIHNLGYLGGLIGLIVALTVVRPQRNADEPNANKQ